MLSAKQRRFLDKRNAILKLYGLKTEFVSIYAKVKIKAGTVKRGKPVRLDNSANHNLILGLCNDAHRRQSELAIAQLCQAKRNLQNLNLSAQCQAGQHIGAFGYRYCGQHPLPDLLRFL